MRNYRKLTTDEKNINRLRKALDKNPTYEYYVAWREAVDAFVLTDEGADLYQQTAMKLLEKARFFPESLTVLNTDNVIQKARFFTGSPKVFRNGYDHAVACLYDAHLLKRIIAARERANKGVLPGMELTSRS